MIYTMGAVRRFSAAHVLTGHPTCGKLHGHSFLVRVMVQGDPDPDIFNFVVDPKVFHERLDALVAELANRHLNEMMPGVIPSAQGIAIWFWERLALQYQLDEVKVWQDDVEAALRRES